MYAWSHTLCHSIHDGPLFQSLFQSGNRDNWFTLRGGVHAYHDPNGFACLQRVERTRWLHHCQMPPFSGYSITHGQTYLSHLAVQSRTNSGDTFPWTKWNHQFRKWLRRKLHVRKEMSRPKNWQHSGQTRRMVSRTHAGMQNEKFYGLVHHVETTLDYGCH